MHMLPRARAAIAAIGAVAAVFAFAGVALAAPVLQPGVTSAPGMSGTCTSCHTYAKPATTAANKPKATVVSHPYKSAKKAKAGVGFKLWGYVSPKLPNTNEATLTISVQQRKSDGSWVATSGLTTRGTVSASGTFKNKTNYTATMKVGAVGRFRVQAKLVWVDAKGVAHSKKSTRFEFKVYK